MTYQTMCSAGCNNTWHSQPLIRAMPLGNLLLSGAVLFTGGHYAKMSDFAEILNLGFISESTYYSIQGTYLYPVVENTYNLQQTAILAALADEEISVMGDGQCDTPGHNAKYLTYSLLEEETELIVSSKVVCLGEEEIKSSNAMEVEGLDRCLDELETHHITISEVATDRHPLVTHYMKNQRPEIDHQYEIFHTAKGVTKELTRLCHSRETDIVHPWIQSISNHLWWSSATCEGNAVVGNSRLLLKFMTM